jgi:hypothetical protein
MSDTAVETRATDLVRSIVLMAMMQIRIVHVRMYKVLVTVRVAMRLARRIIWPVLVLMMLVVNVRVCMFHLLVGVNMLVALGQV